MPLPRLLRTTSFRLTLVHASAFAVSVTVLFAIIYWSTAGYLSRQLDESTDIELSSVLDDQPAAGLARLRQEIQKRTRKAPPGLYYLLQDSSGKVLAGNLPATNPSDGIVETTEPTLFENGKEPHGYRGRGVRTVGGAYLLVASDNFQLEEMEELIQRAFGLAFGVTVLLGLAGGALVSAMLLRRIEIVSQTSREIIDGNLERRMPIRGSDDEFDHLAMSLNAMLDRIGGLMEGLRQVSNDVAHDLRTPLTRLRQRLERARFRATTVGELQEALGESIGDVDNILETFGALLRIAQIEGGSRRATFIEVDVSELMQSMAEIYQPVAEEKGQPLSCKVAPGLSMTGDRELLVQMLSNLIENAIRYSPAGAEISLEAWPSGQGLCMMVGDRGPGIPAEYHAKVFQRFFRLDHSRTTAGNGLGLSLVAAIAALHDLEISLRDRYPGLMVALRRGAAP